ncbi:TPA: hypothetical protein ACQ2HY_003323 [Klebsiella pneumoniae]
MENNIVKVIAESEIRKMLNWYEKITDDIDFMVSKAKFYDFNENFIKAISDKRITDRIKQNISMLELGVFREGEYELIKDQKINIEEGIKKYVGDIDKIKETEEKKRRNNKGRMITLKIQSYDNKNTTNPKNYVFFFKDRFSIRVERDDEFENYQRRFESNSNNTCIIETPTYIEYNYDQRYTQQEQAFKDICRLIKLRKFRYVFASSNKEYIEDAFYKYIIDERNKSTDFKLIPRSEDQYNKLKFVYKKEKGNLIEYIGRYGISKYSRGFSVNHTIRTPLERKRDNTNFKQEVKMLSEPKRNMRGE